MKYFVPVSLIILLFASTSTAQTNVSVKKNDFKTIKDGFNIAWKHVTEGDKYFSDGGIWFDKALDEYLMANNYNGNNAELNYKIGVASLYSDSKEQAARYLGKAVELKNDVAEDALLMLGLALRYGGRYDEAIEELNVFIDSEMKKPEKSIIKARKVIEECTSALQILRDTSRIEIKNIGGNINSESDDYSEVLTSDGRKLFFASRRAIAPNAKNFYDDTKFDENIFISDNTGNQW
jgi:tetratricopeptide (TPR) repeat protein